MNGRQLVPFGPPGAATRIEAWVERSGGQLWARWLIDTPAAGLVLPMSTARDRRDELWRTTCGELFLAGEGSAYLEINAAPSGDWAAYRFTGPREGMTPALLAAPVITLDAGEDWVSLEASVWLPPDRATSALDVNIAAVIEGTDGSIAHWALAHPPGRPDFHDRSCFRLRLPAAA